MAHFTILHAADLHLDAPFEGVGRTPAPIAAALRDASVDVWDGLVDLALARQVAAVLLAGGVCGGLERGVRAQARFRDGLTRLSAAGIAVFLALGDDDPRDGFAAVRAWPSTVSVFPAGRPTALPLLYGGRRVAIVHGMSAPPQSGTDAPPPRFVRGDVPGPHLAVVHAGIAGHASDDGACRVRYRLADLHAAQMDYWALGHHAAADRVAAGTPWIVYSGTPQGRSLAPAQCGAKGAALIAIEDGVVTGVEVEPVDRVRCLPVTVGGVDDPAALGALLAARAAELRASHSGRGLLLDGRIDGTPAVRRLLHQPAARAVLLHEVRAAAAAAEPFVWWVGVRAVNAAAAAGEPATPDLAGEIHRQRAALADDGARCAAFAARQFAPLQALWAAEADPRETAEILDAAAALAADALHGDDG